jgi:hypothetical protein
MKSISHFEALHEIRKPRIVAGQRRAEGHRVKGLAPVRNIESGEQSALSVVELQLEYPIVHPQQQISQNVGSRRVLMDNFAGST